MSTKHVVGCGWETDVGFVSVSIRSHRRFAAAPDCRYADKARIATPVPASSASSAGIFHTTMFLKGIECSAGSFMAPRTCWLSWRVARLEFFYH